MSGSIQSERVLNATQAADVLGVSRRWLIREGIRKYKIPYLRPPGSRQLLFMPSDLARVLKAWRVSDRIGSSPRERSER